MLMKLRNKWYRFQYKWKQFWCPHHFDDSKLISRTVHPEILTHEDFVYVKNHRQCTCCEKYWDDNGLELSISVDEWLEKGRKELEKV